MFDAAALLSDAARTSVPRAKASQRPNDAKADFDRLLKPDPAEAKRSPVARAEPKDRAEAPKRAEKPDLRPEWKDAKEPTRHSVREGHEHGRHQRADEAHGHRNHAKTEATNTDQATTDASPIGADKPTTENGSEKPTEPVEAAVAVAEQAAQTPAQPVVAQPLAVPAPVLAQAIAVALPQGELSGETTAEGKSDIAEGATDEITAAQSGIASTLEAQVKPTATPTVVAEATVQVAQTSIKTTTVEQQTEPEAIAVGSGDAKAAKTDRETLGQTSGSAAQPQETSAKATLGAKDTARAVDAPSAITNNAAPAAVQSPAPVSDIANAKAAQTATSTPDRAEAPVPVHAMAVEVGMRAMRGAREFSIRLDPENLGRVDIQLEISEAGEVQAKLMVERVETLALLQRDAKTLERAFDQAGLKSNPDALQFSLRDPGQQNRQNGDQQQGRQGQSAFDGGLERMPEIETATRQFQFTRRDTGGVDISI